VFYFLLQKTESLNPLFQNAAYATLKDQPNSLFRGSDIFCETGHCVNLCAENFLPQKPQPFRNCFSLTNLISFLHFLASSSRNQLSCLLASELQQLAMSSLSLQARRLTKSLVQKKNKKTQVTNEQVSLNC